MAKIFGWTALVSLLLGLSWVGAGGPRGLLVLSVALGFTALVVHLIWMIVHNDWWPWRYL